MHLICRLFMAVAAFFSMHAMASNYDDEKLVGTWIASPETYDHFVEHGVIVGEYPVLTISHDKKISGYRFGSVCGEDIHVQEINQKAKSEEIENCLLSINHDQSELAVAPALKVVEGKLVEKGGGVWDYIDTNSRYLDWITNLPGEPQSIYPVTKFLFPYFDLVKLHKKISLHYIRGDLRLFVNDGAIGISYTKINPSHLVYSGAIIESLALSYGQYFRCVTKKIVKESELKNQDPEFQELKNLSLHLYKARFEGKLLARALELSASEGEKTKAKKDLYEFADRLENISNALTKTKAYASNSNNKFGKYLGCPDRD